MTLSTPEAVAAKIDSLLEKCRRLHYRCPDHLWNAFREECSWNQLEQLTEIAEDQLTALSKIPGFENICDPAHYANNRRHLIMVTFRMNLPDRS